MRRIRRLLVTVGFMALVTLAPVAALHVGAATKPTDTPTSTPSPTATMIPSVTPLPSVTPIPPTATEQPPHAGSVSVTPNDMTLSAADVAGAGPSITVLGTGLPPHISIVVALSGDGQERELTPAVGQPTSDARGQMSWSGALGSALKAGAYIIKLRVYKAALGGLWNETGALLAQTTLAVKNPPPATCPPGAIGVPWGCQDTGGWWTGATQGLLSSWNTLSDNGRKGFLEVIWDNALHTVDLTQGPYAEIAKYTGPWTTWGVVGIGFLITLRAFFELALWARGKFELWRLLMTWAEVVIVVRVWKTLTGAEHQVWGFCAAYTDSLATMGLKPLEVALAHFTEVNPHDLSSSAAWFLTNIIALAIKLFITYLMAMIVLTRTSMFGVMIAAFVLGPFLVPFFMLRQTRRIALTWLSTILSVSFLPVGYVWALTLAGAAATAIAASGGPLWATLLGAVATGAAILTGVNAMAGAVTWLCTHLTGGAAGLAQAGREKLEEHLQNRTPGGIGGLGRRTFSSTR